MPLNKMKLFHFKDVKLFWSLCLWKSLWKYVNAFLQWHKCHLWIRYNSATFKSGHDKVRAFRYPFRKTCVKIFLIFWWDFLQRLPHVNTNMHNVLVFLQISYRSKNPMGEWWDFSSQLNSHQNPMGEKIL